MNARWIFQSFKAWFPLKKSFIISRFSTRSFPNGPHGDRQSPRICQNHVVTISRLLSLCGREGNFRLGSSLHASIIKNPRFSEFQDGNDIRNALVVWNSLLYMYSKCCPLALVVNAFDDMPVRDTISWNSIMVGYFENGKFESGFQWFRLMFDSGYNRFDQASLTTILSACDGLDFDYVIKMIHCLAIKSGLERVVPVGNALITSYFRYRYFDSAMRTFDGMVERNVITWTAVLSGLVQNEYYEESLDFFVKMQGSEVPPNDFTYLSVLTACSGLRKQTFGCQIHAVLWKLGSHSDSHTESALMDMYSKCGKMKDVWQIFESAKVCDEVSMTVILVGFAQNGFEEEAIQIFTRMITDGYEIDANMVSAVLGVSGIETSLGLGRQVHSLVIKKGFGSNPFVGNGLINMYAKCGELQESSKVFDEMSQTNVVSWNSMIAALARHGKGEQALKFYETMISAGLEPTDVTFLSLLHACSHVGLVDKGLKFLQCMVEVYGITPKAEHYASAVDMIGRAGLLIEARSFIENLPVKADQQVWQALLGACSFYGNTEMGKYAADQLCLAAPGSPAPYILLANIYSSRGRWRERATTIKKMREMCAGKETGFSWIEIEKKIHSFVVADQMHPQASGIYNILLELFVHMSDEGYVPDKRCISYYLSEEKNESSTESLDADAACIGCGS